MRIRLQVEPGPGLWAVVGLMLLITLLASRDIHALWVLTELRPSRQAIRQ